jgi:hypothetical protein
MKYSFMQVEAYITQGVLYKVFVSGTKYFFFCYHQPAASQFSLIFLKYIL